MALENEFLDSNRQRAYPFTDNADLSITTGEDIRDMVVDAYLVYAPRADNAARPAIRTILRFDVLRRVILEFTPSDIVTLEAAALVADRVSDDGAYRTMQWASEDEAVAIVIVFNETLLSGLVNITFENDAAELVPRCAEIQPKRVTSVAIVDGALTVDLGTLFRLAEGNNISLRLDDDSFLRRARELRQPVLRPKSTYLTIAATPGAGDGRVVGDCGPSADAIYRINRVPSLNGRFGLSHDNCYRLSRPSGTIGADTFESDPSALSLSNDCQACCDCAEFVEVLEQIRELKDAGLAAKDTWIAVRAAFNEILDQWNAKIACYGEGCTSRVFAHSFTGWLITVYVWVGNNENCLQEGASISVSFAGGVFDPMYVPGSGMVYDGTDNYQQVDPTELSGVFSMEDNNAVRGGSYKMFVFAVRMRPTSDRVDGSLVDIHANVTACGEEPETLTTNVVLKGNTSKP